VTFEQTLAEAVARAIGGLQKELEGLRSDVKSLLDRLPPKMQLVTVPAAAKQLGVCEATLRRHIKQGRIPVVPVGKGVRIDLAQLQSFDQKDVAAELRARGL
jgi:excisionase family DNA binding protein